MMIKPDTGFFTPLVCCWSFSSSYWLSHSLNGDANPYFRIVDCILFFTAGIAGVVLFFLSCFDTSMRLPELEYHLVATF